MPSQVYSDLNQAKLDDIRERKFRLAQIKLQYSGWAVFTLSRLINEFIIDEIQKKMEQANYSKKIIERTYLSKKIEGKGKTAVLTFHVMSDYISESGFPVAIMMEKGRKSYIVKPHENRPNPHLKFIKDGKVNFRKSVKIPKKEGTFIIRNTIHANKEKIQEAFRQSEKTWMNSILKS